MESKCHFLFGQANIHKFSKIFVILTLYIYVYKSFSITLDKSLRKNIKKKKRRDGELGDINEMGALNMKQKK